MARAGQRVGAGRVVGEDFDASLPEGVLYTAHKRAHAHHGSLKVMGSVRTLSETKGAKKKSRGPSRGSGLIHVCTSVIRVGLDYEQTAERSTVNG